MDSLNPSKNRPPWLLCLLPTPALWPGEFHGLCIVHGVAKSQTRLSDFHFTLFDLNVILSDKSVAVPTHFWSPFTWNIFFYPFILCLCVFFYLKRLFIRLFIYFRLDLSCCVWTFSSFGKWGPLTSCHV